MVLNSLTGQFTDTSLRMLSTGGRCVELGKTDLRDPAEVARAHPGVAYRPFDLVDVAPERIGEILREIVGLFATGALSPPPLTAWDVRRAPEAFRFVSQARHVGKVVLTLPRTMDPEGTVLVTGGTGALGREVARHLVTHHGIRHLVLASRTGGAAGLADELDARVDVAECDITDREALAALLAGLPRLTGVVHLAGVVDDGTVETLTPQRLGAVLAPKIDAARTLHELAGDVDAFVLFSSAGATLGNPGQANYAAANAALDALATHRRAAGLAACSLAWGPWQQTTGMTAGLRAADRRRMSRSGLRPLTTADGLALFDAGMRSAEPVVLAMKRDAAPRVRIPAQRNAPPPASLVDRLSRQPAGERAETVLAVVRAEIAAVLGLPAAADIDVRRPFSDLGFDSLTAVELRNRLNAVTGLRLSGTVVFDRPSAEALARHLLGELVPSPEQSVLAELDGLAERLATLTPGSTTRARIALRLRTIVADWSGNGDTAPPPRADPDDLATASDDELITLIDEEFGR